VEALLCDFHAGDGAVGVMWVGHHCWLGCRGCVGVPIVSWVLVFLEHKRTSKNMGPRPPECPRVKYVA